MNTYRRCLAVMAVAMLALVGVPTARGDAISVGTGLSLNWTSPSDTLVIPVTNGAPSNTAILAGWDLNLQLVPQAGATGTLSIDAASIAFPPNNVLTPGNFPSISAVPGSGAVTQIQVDAVDNNPHTADIVPASGKNLMQLQFISSGASGDFTLQAVDNGLTTGWTDNTTPKPNHFAFSNGGSSFTLGTVHVAPTAVPEPASLMLGAISVVGVAGYRWRRNRQAHATPDPV